MWVEEAGMLIPRKWTVCVEYGSGIGTNKAGLTKKKLPYTAD